MFTLWGDQHRFCDGLSRRNFLRVGALGFGGLTLADVLRARAASAPKKKPRSVIMVCLAGGPSHIDTFDPKPQAPDDIRGEFRPIATNVAGVQFTDQLPLTATVADKLALVRTVQYVEPMQHELQEVYSGFTKADKRPSFGSVISRFKAGDPQLPSYVTLDYGVAEYESPQYLGGAHRPLPIASNEGGGVRNLTPAHGVSRDRMDGRRGLLQSLDTMRRDLDAKRESRDMDVYAARAFDMITSGKAREAFDLTREPDRVRQRYGIGDRDTFHYAGTDGLVWGSSKFLLARRLVEAGVPVVTLRAGAWDHHGTVLAGKSIFYNLRSELPLLDRSLHALVTDLHERGLNDEVLVLVWGEMGRTPRISQTGRDHWMDAGFALFAGGGLKTGQVVGETDSHGARPKTRPLGPQNVLATVYDALGIDLDVVVPDFAGRPQYLLDNREPITELLG